MKLQDFLNVIMDPGFKTKVCESPDRVCPCPLLPLVWSQVKGMLLFAIGWWLFFGDRKEPYEK